jgi:hypothetical protein
MSTDHVKDAAKTYECAKMVCSQGPGRHRNDFHTVERANFFPILKKAHSDKGGNDPEVLKCIKFKNTIFPQAPQDPLLYCKGDVPYLTEENKNDAREALEKKKESENKNLGRDPDIQKAKAKAEALEKKNAKTDKRKDLNKGKEYATQQAAAEKIKRDNFGTRFAAAAHPEQATLEQTAAAQRAAMEQKATEQAAAAEQAAAKKTAAEQAAAKQAAVEQAAAAQRAEQAAVEQAAAQRAEQAAVEQAAAAEHAAAAEQAAAVQRAQSTAFKRQKQERYNLPGERFNKRETVEEAAAAKKDAEDKCIEELCEQIGGGTINVQDWAKQRHKGSCGDILLDTVGMKCAELLSDKRRGDHGKVETDDSNMPSPPPPQHSFQQDEVNEFFNLLLINVKQ